MAKGKEYPKVLYHSKKAPVTVKSPAEQAKLGKGWTESPVEEPEPDAEEPEHVKHEKK